VHNDKVEAMGFGDRIAVLSDGRVRQIGPPIEVYDHPADTFVATFIGSPPMNLVPRDGVLVGFRPGPLLPVGAGAAGGASRPEHLRPGEAVAAAERATMRMSVDRVEYLSGDRHLYGTVTGIGERTRVVARLPATVHTPIAAGEEHDFAVPADRLRFFDADTGQRPDAVRL